ncbi:hypothetical protein [Streptomyces sp. NPDC059009]|uniref:hypothetical protein n=1 Tax=Streptomyces sp. NPDC059009 TaxID=3346694 RepID=UPI003682BA22
MSETLKVPRKLAFQVEVIAMETKICEAVDGVSRGRVTVADYLAAQGLPADWRFASAFGRVAAEMFRQDYGREPSLAFQLINGHFRSVMAYRLYEVHVLATAWETYPRTACLPVLTA